MILFKFPVVAFLMAEIFSAGAFGQQVNHGTQLKQLLLANQAPWSPDLPTGPEASFTNQDRRRQSDAWKVVAGEIRKAAANQSGTYKIPEGHYRIVPNGDRIFKGLRNLTIDATNVTIWFGVRHVYGLEFDKCENVTINGLTIDCDPFPHSQAKIVSIGPQSQEAELMIMPGYAIPNAGSNRLTFYKSDGSFNVHGPTTGSIKRIEGNRFSAKSSGFGKANPGDYVVISERTGFALNTSGCKDMVFQNLNIFASGGMGIRESGGRGGSIYRNVRITRRPGTNRLHATGADGFHIVSLEKGPIVENSEIAYLSDDIMNLHGYFGRVVEAASGREVRVKAQSAPFNIGQKLKFWNQLSIRLTGEAKITGVTKEKDAWLLALDTDVKVGANNLVEHFNRVCGGFAVRNCWFHDNFNRGFLLNGASPGVIENNLFENIASRNLAIQMETWKYDEGQFIHGLSITGNHFYGGGIDMNLIAEADGVYSQTPCSDVSIKNNVIRNGSIQVRNVDSLVIAGNTVTTRVGKDWNPGVFWEDEKYTGRPGAGIYATVVRNAAIHDNNVDFVGGGSGDKEVFGNLTRNISLNQVKQWEAIADANSGWMPSASQGNLGWYYGYAESGPVRNGSYKPEMFVRFDRNAAGRWLRAGKKEYLYIEKRATHPEASYSPVRRWVSSVSGLLKLEGRLQNGSGGGVKFYVYINGKNRWALDVSNRNVHSFKEAIGNVQVGDAVDLVLDSKGNPDRDATDMSLRLLTEPDPRSVNGNDPRVSR